MMCINAIGTGKLRGLLAIRQNVTGTRNFVNKVILVGRVGKDAHFKPFANIPEKSSLNSKNGFFTFPVVTEEFVKSDADPSGWIKRATWHNIYYKTSREEPYLQSSIVAIEGKLEVSKKPADSENAERQYVSIVASSVRVLSKKSPRVADAEASGFTRDKSEFDSAV